jgi:hypothetical protein
MGDGNQLDILIRTIADLHGAEAVRDSLKKIEQSGTSAGEGVAAANQKAGEATELFNTHGREMHRLIHELDHMAPGLGVALRSAVHPSGLGIAATVVIIQQLVEHFQKMQEEARKAREETAAVTVAVWDAARTGADQARDAAEKYIKTIRDSGRALDDLKTKEALETAIFGERIKQWEKLLDLMGKKPAETVTDAASLKLLKQQVERRKAGQEELDQAAFEAERKKEAAIKDTGEAGAAAKRLETLTSKQVGLKAAADYAEVEKIPEFEQRVAAERGKLDTAHARASAAAQWALTQAKEAAAALAKNQEEIARNEAITRAHDARVRAATDAADEAAKRRDANRSATVGGLNSIATGEGLLRERETGERNRRLFAPGGEMERKDLIIGHGASAFEAQKHGQKISDNQKQDIAALNQLLQDLGWGNAAIREMFKRLISVGETHNAGVKAIKTQLEQLESRVNKIAH